MLRDIDCVVNCVITEIIFSDWIGLLRRLLMQFNIKWQLLHLQIFFIYVKKQANSIIHVESLHSVSFEARGGSCLVGVCCREIWTACMVKLMISVPMTEYMTANCSPQPSLQVYDEVIKHVSDFLNTLAHKWHVLHVI